MFLVPTTDRSFKKRGYERDEFLFRTVIKIRKIQFTQFLHTSASKFFLRALPRYYMLQPMLDILFYIALLSSKILVLFGLDFRAGNSKFQRPKVPARSVGVHSVLRPVRLYILAIFWYFLGPITNTQEWFPI